jgi:hypothetical protein
MLVTFKNISANKPSTDGWNEYLSSHSNGRERERERVIVQQNSCERVSDGGIDAQSRTNPDRIMCAGLQTIMFTITDIWDSSSRNMNEKESE